MTGKRSAGGLNPSRSSNIPPGSPDMPLDASDYPSDASDYPSDASDYRSDWITVMLTLERPSHEELRHYSRRAKYRALRSSARGIRDELMRWIDEHGLAKDVARVGEPTAFNTLFVTTTRYAAERLGEAPGVVGVAPTGDISVDLFSLPELPSPDEEEGIK